MIKAFLALGSNIQNPIHQVKTAIVELAEMANINLIKTSSLYCSSPVGILDQPKFINAVVEVETNLCATALLNSLLAIEKKHHRLRKIKNGPRTLDLDILLYGKEVFNNSFLEIPHPRLKERVFVVYPLAEIAPKLVLPCGTTIKSLMSQFQNHDLEMLCATTQGEACE